MSDAYLAARRPGGDSEYNEYLLARRRRRDRERKARQRAAMTPEQLAEVRKKYDQTYREKHPRPKKGEST